MASGKKAVSGPRCSGIEIVANSRYDWTGWLELAMEPVDEVDTRMTGQVIHDVHADVQGLVEVEDRPSLDRFNEDLLSGQFGHVMLIDGNDPRGIDVGIMATEKVEIVSMHSNVDEPDPGAPGEHLFSRDCAEYLCRLATKETVRVLLNHFKSQSGGGGEKRARQAKGDQRAAEQSRGNPISEGNELLCLEPLRRYPPDAAGYPKEEHDCSRDCQNLFHGPIFRHFAARAGKRLMCDSTLKRPGGLHCRRGNRKIA